MKMGHYIQLTGVAGPLTNQAYTHSDMYMNITGKATITCTCIAAGLIYLQCEAVTADSNSTFL